jgi:hypothetical protein
LTPLLLNNGRAFNPFDQVCTIVHHSLYRW